jgi:hypothetical protein
MRFRHAAALTLVGFFTAIAANGCLFLYPVGVEYHPNPDPSLHVAGWKCPDPDKMPRIVTYATPPCSWIPGAVLVSNSCLDRLQVKRDTALGCVASSPIATPTFTP